ncbi:MAG: UDP-2,4-diacetamido-2,4,6-trideoxy-beta-L-altropyranose hydrolase [Rhodospirillales bacterium]|nr:UDP-2,4-diacetamido-2,4,6-trideoxy-beta-L-altropyranose hydrolase [Rhodospirillales bacterium]
MSENVVTVRADCDAAIGYGHVMRCLAVAVALKELGTDTRFAMVSGSDRTPVEAQGYEVLALDASGLARDEMIAALDPQEGPLLLDSYAIGENDLESLRAAGFRVALFDDAMRLKHYACDVVIDSAPEASSLPYRGLPETRFCLGTDYFPLRREFTASHGKRQIRDRVETVIVSFGGSDHDDVTYRALKAIADVDGDFEILAVLGPAYVGRADEAALDDGRVRLVRGVDDMAALMASADVAICSGGGTALEMAYLGVPMAVLSLSPDQVPVARALAESGAAIHINDTQAINEPDILAAMNKLLNDTEKKPAMSEAGQALIDGQGAARVARAIRQMNQY